MGNEPGEPLLESRRKILKGVWPFAISLAGNDTSLDLALKRLDNELIKIGAKIGGLAEKKI